MLLPVPRQAFAAWNPCLWRSLCISVDTRSLMILRLHVHSRNDLWSYLLVGSIVDLRYLLSRHLRHRQYRHHSRIRLDQVLVGEGVMGADKSLVIVCPLVMQMLNP